MRRRLLLTASAMCAAALLAGLWATGGLRAAPRPAQRSAKTAVDLGRYRLRVADVVVRQVKRGGATLVVTLRVTVRDRRSLPVMDFAVNALSLDVPRGTKITPISAVGRSQDLEVSMLNPGVPTTVVLTYGLGDGPVPAGFHARLSLWRYENREDFFYGYRHWIPRKPDNAKEDDVADYVVPLPIRWASA
ncbi:hypothetical protein [Actinoallomurus sp. NPDC052274]|uniref:hypothetical protein n=1 Tax=Actinoallomurus sp. NPDC052274 TaxID=3155420 RepID=UPI003426310C